MSLNEIYQLPFLGLMLIIATWLIQAVVASSVKASQKGAIPGKIDTDLSHSSIVFRTHRTFMNSLENVPIMLATIFASFFIGVDTFWLTISIWVFAVARILHMVLYYKIATETNPSPRSYFYLIGLSANIVLLVLCLISLV